MTITQKNENGKITISLDGWLDHESSPEVNDVIDQIAEMESLTLDFEKVEYISSAGIRTLVSAHRKAKACSATFSVVHVNKEILSILAMTGLDKKLGIQ